MALNAANSVAQLRAPWSEAEGVKARSFFCPFFDLFFGLKMAVFLASKRF